MPLKALHLLLHLLIHLQYGNAIIGGENIEISKFKHHARLVDVHTPNPVFASCGGTLVSYSHILTAADCLIGYVNYPKNIRVLLGGITGGDGMIFEIQKITIHPSYQSANDPGDNNLAIISLGCQLKLWKNILPIRLAKEPTKPETRAVLIGLGFQEKGQYRTLQKLRLEVIGQRECDYFYPKRTNDICARNPDNSTFEAEPIDNGGGLVADNLLIGVLSRALIKAGLGKPETFTDVYYHIKWIESITEEKICLPFCKY